MTYILIFDPLNRFIWTLTIFIIFICGIQTLIKAINIDKGSEERYLLFGFGTLFIGLGITRLVLFISDYFLIGYYEGHVYMVDLSKSSPTYAFLGVISSYILFISCTIAFYFIEKILNKNKYIITLTGTFLIIIALLLPLSFFISVSSIFSFLFVLSFLLLLLQLMRASAKKFKPIIAVFFVGSMLLIIGILLTSEVIKAQNLRSPTFPAIYIIAGSIICISPTIFNIKTLKNEQTIWMFCICVITISLADGFLFIITYKLPTLIFLLSLIGLIIGMVILGAMFIQLFKNYSKLETIQEQNSNESQKEFLKINIKQLLSKEEIILHRENLICIACEKIINRNAFICSNCDIIYCLDCYHKNYRIKNNCIVCGLVLNDIN